MRPRYFWDTPNRVNAHPTDVVSESGPAFEHRILGSAPEAQDIVQDVWFGGGARIVAQSLIRANRKKSCFAVKLTVNAQTVEVNQRCPEVRFGEMTA